MVEVQITKPVPVKIDTPKVVMILASSSSGGVPPVLGGIGTMIIGSTNIVG
jgi:hypothetical protein